MHFASRYQRNPSTYYQLLFTKEETKIILSLFSEESIFLLLFHY